MPDEDKYYAVKEADLVAIADRTRVMANISESLSIPEIIYWLGRVAYIPQGRVDSEFSLSFGPNVSSGALPTVAKGSATSGFTLDFESTAV